MDHLSSGERSALMSRVRGADTKPELIVRRGLWRAGLRYRLQVRSLPGSPDIVLPRWSAAVFVHGCFWHGHRKCAAFRLPATRTDFWHAKVENNRQRDLRAVSALTAQGWRVAVIWECSVKNDSSSALDTLVHWVRSDLSMIDIRGKLRD